MSVPEQDLQATFFDATFLAQDLFNAKDRYEIFRREVYPALQAMRQELCQLYCADNGRPGIEPVVMAGVTLLQFMEKVPDRKAVELVRLHLVALPVFGVLPPRVEERPVYPIRQSILVEYRYLEKPLCFLIDLLQKNIQLQLPAQIHAQKVEHRRKKCNRVLQ